MSNDETAPFGTPDPHRGPEFEVDESSLHGRSPFDNQPTEAIPATDAHTKVMPQFDGSDAPTQAIGTHQTQRTQRIPEAPLNYPADAPTQRIATGQRFAPPSQRTRTPAYTDTPHQPQVQHFVPQARADHASTDSSRELTAGGWWRLLIGGILLLVAAWLLLRGAMGMVTITEGAGYDSLLNIATFIGAPLLVFSLLLLPGSAGGRVASILLAALAYGALTLPPLLYSPQGDLWVSQETGYRLVVMVVPAVVVLFGIMTWLSVRGKRALAWVLVFLPPLAMFALIALVPSGDGEVFPQTGLINVAMAEQWLAANTPFAIGTADLLTTSLYLLFAACVVPAVLLAWPFGSAKQARMAGARRA